MQLGRSVDADGHVLEPPDLWKKNLEAKFKDRALGLARDEEGIETVIVEGCFSSLSRVWYCRRLRPTRRGGLFQRV